MRSTSIQIGIYAEHRENERLSCLRLGEQNQQAMQMPSNPGLQGMRCPGQKFEKALVESCLELLLTYSMMGRVSFPMIVRKDWSQTFLLVLISLICLSYWRIPKPSLIKDPPLANWPTTTVWTLFPFIWFNIEHTTTSIIIQSLPSKHFSTQYGSLRLYKQCNNLDELS